MLVSSAGWWVALPNGGSLPVVCVCGPGQSIPFSLPSSFPSHHVHPTQPFTHPPEKLRANKCTKQKRADSTLGTSQAVPHPSTIRALCHLTSEVGRDPVYLTRYGRQQMNSITIFLQQHQTGQAHCTPPSSPASKSWERNWFSCSVCRGGRAVRHADAFRSG